MLALSIKVNKEVARIDCQISYLVDICFANDVLEFNVNDDVECFNLSLLVFGEALLLCFLSNGEGGGGNLAGNTGTIFVPLLL